MPRTLEEPLLHPEAKRSLTDQEIKKVQKETYLNVSVFSYMFFGWLSKYIEIGNKRPFQQNMHSELRYKDKTETSYYELKEGWESSKTKTYPLLRALIWTFKNLLVRGTAFAMASRLSGLIGPLIMRDIIMFVKTPGGSSLEGITLVFWIGVLKIGSTVCYTQANFIYRIVGLRAFNAINALLYGKSLKYSLIRSPDQSFGQLLNYMQVDAGKILTFTEQASAVITMPFQILLGIYLLYSLMGISFLPGTIIIIIAIYFNYKLNRRNMILQKQVMKKKDERMKVMNEIVNGIKFIKMNGWEEYFLTKAQDKRVEELKILKAQFTNRLWVVLSGWVLPMVITVVIFTTHIFLGRELTAEIAFPVVAILLTLQDPLRFLPVQLTTLLESMIAVNRLQKFLLAEEIDTKYIKRHDGWGSDVALKIQNGFFYWNEPGQKKDLHQKVKKNSQKRSVSAKTISPTEGQVCIEMSERKESAVSSKSSIAESERSSQYILKDINLEIKKGSFVAFIGDVGSGKSSLLYSILGEMKYHDHNLPEVTINGEIAYVSQKPWILNETLKGNVLLGNSFNEDRYREALKYSCLEADLQILQNGDQTEIGEKGINLSGGQKARVSLAQAIYADKDIYLLDDPLSAVDVHVGTYIIQECLTGYLKNKTRVLITHNLDYLKYVDYIYIMKRGRIVDQGTYKEIVTHSLFNKILESKHHQDGEKKSESEETKKNSKSKDETHGSKGQQSKKGGQLAKKESEAKDKEKEEVGDTAATRRLILNEDRQTGKVNVEVYKAFYNFYGGFRFFSVFLSSMILWLVLSLSSNVYLSYWTTKTHEGETEDEFYYLKIYAALSLAYAFFNVIRSASVLFKSVECSENIHLSMMKSVIRAPINLFFDRVPIGRVLNRFSKDLNVVDNGVANSIIRFVQTLFQLISDIIVCVYGGTYYVIPLIAVFFYFSYKTQQKYQRLNREVVRLESISRSPILSQFSETLTGLTSIRGYRMEDRFFTTILHQQDENMKNQMILNALSNWFYLRCSLLSLILIIPTIGLSIVLTHSYAASGALAGLVITYALSCDDDIKAALQHHVNFENNLISIERCLNFINIRSEAPETASNPKAIKGFSPEWPERGNIQFVDYSVRYRPSLPLVLKDLSVNILPSQKIGIVGRTGSGKSTLIASILRMIEAASGAIVIDDVNIADVGLYDLRKKITVVPQDPMLFNGTVRENIDIAREFKDEQIWEVIEKVSLKEKFNTPEGLDAKIKDEGGNLSAGEKQLICIARAILKRNKIVLIDEATSNIDVETEKTIQRTIHEKLKDSTVLTIAHRLNTIIDSDAILVMDSGRAIEFDAPQKLLQDSHSVFYGLWTQAQKAKTDEIS